MQGNQENSRPLRFDPELLAQRLPDADQVSGFCVGFSGGGDSSALLYAMATLRSGLDVPLRAVHIHHGLNPQADSWVEGCESRCQELELPLQVLKVDPKPYRSMGPEGAAREARQRGFEQSLGKNECLLTAHHLEDQAETVLLRLLRGTGIEGLAAMARRRLLGEGWILRPLLDVPRAALREYLTGLGHPWIEDPSNDDTRFDRNFLRHEILPLLRQRWPACDQAISRLASNARETGSIVQQRAAEDLAMCLSPDPAWLRIPPMLELQPARRNAMLRLWLAELGMRVPSRKAIEKIYRELIQAPGDRNPRLRWPETEVRRFRDLITAFGTPPAPPQDTHWNPAQENELALSCGVLSLQGGQVPSDWRWQIRTRQGGESLKPAGASCTRTLKNLLHERGVPPWVRKRLPLVFENDQLIAIADLYLSQGLHQRLRDAGLSLHWHPNHPAAGV